MMHLIENGIFGHSESTVGSKANAKEEGKEEEEEGEEEERRKLSDQTQ